MKPIDLFRAGFWGSDNTASIIAGLFAQGQQGFWLPFTDFDSLTQDSAGTLPYTALEQPVGRVLDRSQGLRLGAQIANDPDMTSLTGLPNNGGLASPFEIVPWEGAATTLHIGGPNFSGTILPGAFVGKTYFATVRVWVVSGGCYFGSSTSRIGNTTLVPTGGWQTLSGYTSPSASGFACYSDRAGSEWYLDSVNFYEVLGNHATQVTSTARGAVGARGNALLNTDNPAVWGYAGSRFSVGAKDVDGGWPLTHLVAAVIAVNTDYPIGASGVADATIVRSIELQAGTASYVTFGAASGYDAVTIDLVSKVIVANLGARPVTITTLADNWIRVEFWASRVGSFSASSLSNYMFWGVSQGVATVGSTIKVRKPSYSRQALGYTAPIPYQRVGATPTDYDAVGFPKYLRLDGTDDFYTCSGGGSTTGFYYSDVVRPTSSATTVLFSDIGTNSGYEFAIMNTGVLKLFWGNGTSFSSVSIGGVLISALNHVAVWDDASNIYLQINGGTPVTVARGVFVAGTANCKLYRTNGASAFFFNGQVTEPIYRAGPPPNAYERDVIRNYQMQKAGML